MQQVSGKDWRVRGNGCQERCNALRPELKTSALALEVRVH